MPSVAAYDNIGGLFESFTDTAAQRAVEVRTILSMAGDVSGQSVLDLACGYGYFGRELLKRGASSVRGVDISEKMIALARAESEKTGDGIQFQVGNVCELETVGKFDVVLAAWLFNYAESREDLKKMFKAVMRNLKPSGKLVAYTVDPDFELARGNFAAYGVNVLDEQPWQGGFRHHAEFVTQPPSPFTFFRWSRADYQEAIAEAGFSRMEWQAPLLLESDIRQFKPGFWSTFQQNCLQTGLHCRP